MVRERNEDGFLLPPNKTKKHEMFRKVATTTALGILSVAAFIGERRGIVQPWSQPQRAIAESCSHPVLGYIGAWLATSGFSGDKSTQNAAVITVTTSINFLVETAQSLVLDPSNHIFSFLYSQNLPETAKDYAFAAGGALLYLAQNGRENLDSEE